MERDDQALLELVRAAQAGDRESAGRLFELLGDRVYRFLLLRTSSVEVAEDLTQTVFLEMVRALPRYKEQQGVRFTTWLFQIAHFRLIDHYRRSRPSASLDDVPEPAADEPSHADPFDVARLNAALQTLPERQRAILHLRFREGRSASEVARILKISSINVRVIQSRALRTLRHLLTTSPDHL